MPKPWHMSFSWPAKPALPYQVSLRPCNEKSPLVLILIVSFQQWGTRMLPPAYSDPLLSYATVSLSHSDVRAG
jgi:hypothetical protein